MLKWLKNLFSRRSADKDLVDLGSVSSETRGSVGFYWDGATGGHQGG